MVIASDYPFLDILGSMLVFFGFVVWFWLLITIFSDIFRRHDIHGGVRDSQDCGRVDGREESQRAQAGIGLDELAALLGDPEVAAQ